ncbi:MAG TPA: right-handed parallel beta-helix repeat-containing protein [Steroidobacteraceae bacterium]|jgi:parallel beta-helix repeat protein
MATKRRSTIAVVAFAVIVAIALLGRWYALQRAQPERTAAKSAVVHVTNAADRGPGTLREALFLVAGAKNPTTISIDVPKISVETALPAFVNGRGVRLVGQAGGVQIDAQQLVSGPVLDISGPNTSIEGITVIHCPAAAILVRAVHLHLANSTIDSCDVGVEVAENASDTLLERNRFLRNRLGIRFAASGHNTAVASNQFTDNKDASIWAVRSAPDPRDDAINIHDNKFTADRIGVLAGNVPVLVQRNDFINAREADVHLVGAGGVVRGNHVTGGSAMGIVAENARGAIIDDNEIEGLGAYGVMVRGSANTLVRANRLHNCGYGLAFVLGDVKNVSTAVENTIIEPKFNGIDVIGDSPILRRNQVLRPHAYALHVEDFQPPSGDKVRAQPFLDNNNFGSSPVSRPVAAAAPQSHLR